MPGARWPAAPAGGSPWGVPVDDLLDQAQEAAQAAMVGVLPLPAVRSTPGPDRYGARPRPVGFPAPARVRCHPETGPTGVGPGWGEDHGTGTDQTGLVTDAQRRIDTGPAAVLQMCRHESLFRGVGPDRRQQLGSVCRRGTEEALDGRLVPHPPGLIVLVGQEVGRQQQLQRIQPPLFEQEPVSQGFKSAIRRANRLTSQITGDKGNPRFRVPPRDRPGPDRPKSRNPFCCGLPAQGCWHRR